MFCGKWGIIDGFALCGGLVAAGFVLHFSAGLFDWGVMAWPVNVVALGVYVVALLSIYIFGRRTRAVRWAMSYAAAVPALASVVAVTFVLGLIRQTPAQEGFWHHILQFWPFILVYAWMATVLGLVTIKHLFSFRLRDIPFLLNHLGLFVVLVAATLGNADMQRLRMVTCVGQAERLAIDGQGRVSELPLGIELREFIMEQYPPKLLIISNATGQALPGSVSIDDGQGELAEWHIEISDRRDTDQQAAYVKAISADGRTASGWVSSGWLDADWQDLRLDSAYTLIMLEGEPRRFASRVTIDNGSGKPIDATIEVNKPARVGMWKIYQLGYDESMGRWSDISVLEMVSDPWLPAVYAGLIMMMLGAVCMFAIPRRKGAER